jgi:hypothetical protein
MEGQRRSLGRSPRRLPAHSSPGCGSGRWAVWRKAPELPAEGLQTDPQRDDVEIAVRAPDQVQA